MVTGTVDVGFHDCIMDCVDADLVMVRAGTSVAIDRVTALLRVAGLADTLRAAIAWLRHRRPAFDTMAGCVRGEAGN